MAYLKTDNPKKILKLLTQGIQIYCKNEPVSICASHILMNVFTSKLIKHEMRVVGFQEEVPSNEFSKVLVDVSKEDPLVFGDTAIISDYTGPYCSLMTAYSLARNLNLVDNSILWAMAVCLKEQNPLLEEIILEIRRLNPTENFFDGISYRAIPALNFLNCTSLYDSLSNDLSFLAKNRLQVHRIGTHLARLGISLRDSQERFTNLPEYLKSLISKSFPSTQTFIRNLGYSTRFTSEEHFFILCYFLSLKNPIQALLTLKDGSFIAKSDVLLKSAEFYYGLVGCLRKARFSQLRRIRILLVDRIECRDASIYLHVLHGLTEHFIKLSNRPNLPILLIVEDWEEHTLVYARSEWMPDAVAGIRNKAIDFDGYGYQIKKEDLKYFLGNLEMV
ncbi:hypothetical protein TCON_0403 [Astathelohania contejeani]|uniref:Uncharacterized protein n=1 Tax=Astathelohania contejeani TaxID=164912 RepID=A0ABQ7I1R4_9MICR|nr:hypothetical protein TCON_0403 [Thelohania contejeani]